MKPCDIVASQLIMLHLRSLGSGTVSFINLFPPGIEPGTFRVLGGCDNHYTTETAIGIANGENGGQPVRQIAHGHEVN